MTHRARKVSGISGRWQMEILVFVRMEVLAGEDNTPMMARSP
jgi:hypothetical protein